MKPSEIWKEIKPRIGEMLVAVNDIETRAEKAQEEAYQRGLNDAREGKASCQFCEYEMCSDRADPCRICACNYMNFFEPKKQEQEEQIQVGDEVEAMAGNAVVIEVIDGGQTVRYMYPDTITGRNKACNVTRTGRHFPEIAEVLQKMKES